MESDMELEYDPQLISAVKNRASGLLLKFCVLRSSRYQSLYDKYRNETVTLKHLDETLVKAYRKINDLCSRMLNITYNLDAKSTAVISAILNNVFSKKATIDDLFFNMNRTYARVEKDFKRCEFLLYRLSLDIANSREAAEAESLLKQLHGHVILINEKVSDIFEKSYTFLFALERTRKKIDKVVKQ